MSLQNWSLTLDLCHWHRRDSTFFLLCFILLKLFEAGACDSKRNEIKFVLEVFFYQNILDYSTWNLKKSFSSIGWKVYCFCYVENFKAQKHSLKQVSFTRDEKSAFFKFSKRICSKSLVFKAVPVFFVYKIFPTHLNSKALKKFP